MVDGYLSFEVLMHELAHGCHTAHGTRDKRKTDPKNPNETGWEEVRTIQDINYLREWYNKCGRPRPGERRPLKNRDPYSHDWSRKIQEDDRPEGDPGPPVWWN